MSWFLIFSVGILLNFFFSLSIPRKRLKSWGTMVVVVFGWERKDIVVAAMTCSPDEWIGFVKDRDVFDADLAHSCVLFLFCFKVTHKTLGPHSL